jgi:TolB protein
MRHGIIVILLIIAATVRGSGASHRIVFTRIAPAQMRLFISRADGTEERPLLPATSLDYNPAWSPDGQWIAFTSERNGSADLYRVRPDGTGLERLTDSPAFDDQAAFSPDGSEVVFVTTRVEGNADLWILDIRTHKAKALTSGPGGDFRPAWSPDGKWIAFSSDRGSTLPQGHGRWEHLQIVDIYLVRPDGSGLKRITEHGNFCGSPKWTADSNQLVAYCMSAQETLDLRSLPPAESATQLVRIDVATGKTSNVSVGPGVKLFPAVLGSGDIAWLRRDVLQIEIVYGAGNKGPSGFVWFPAWSPDSTRVVYTRLDPASADTRWKNLWSRNPAYELDSTWTLPAFHPAGDRYLAMTPAAPLTGALAGLAILETSTHKSKTIFQDKERNVVAAQWSPRGDSILFGLGAFKAVNFQGDFSAGRVDGGAQVFAIKPDGSGLREVTSGTNNNGFPSFAPDGKHFVYRTAGPEGQGLRIMNLETRTVTTLTTEYDNFPLWSPRGNLIVFVRQVQGDFEIYTIQPDGQNLRRLTHSPGNDSHCAWSPDGEWIVFSSTRMGFKDEALYTFAPQPYGELFVMRYDGTHVQQLTDNQWEDAGPAWQPAHK